MRDKSRVKHLVQKLNANINYDTKPQIDYAVRKIRTNPLVKRFQTCNVENHLEKQTPGLSIQQETEDGVAPKKSPSWKQNSTSEVVAGQCQNGESQKKAAPSSSNGCPPMENGDHAGGNMSTASNEELSRLRESENRLVNEMQELREQNELLEFRLLELEYYNMNSTNRSDTAEDRDDISDSGVTSLSPCDDFYLDFDSVLDTKLDDDEHHLISNDIQHKLTKLGEYVENKSDKLVVQRAIDLIKHYQLKATGMETALTNMCRERIHRQCEIEFIDCLKGRDKEQLKVKPNRVVATVPPFSSQRNDSASENYFLEPDRLHESGIFDEFGELEAIECKSCKTQTDTDSLDSCSLSEHSSGGLADELSKLEKIKRRIEERRSLFHSLELTSEEEAGEESKAEAKPPDEGRGSQKAAILAKELSYYKNHYRLLEEKLSAYEANPDSKSRRLSDALTKESVLQHRVDYLTSKMMNMQKEMKRLEEEKCEFEEAENDTRLRCQKLEVKLHALAEKKNDIQFQLQQHSRTISSLRNTLAELEKKKDAVFQKSLDMETLANEYEQRNFELEERELEVRYRLQMLENVVPALILWNVLTALRRIHQRIEKRFQLTHRLTASELLPICDAQTAVPNFTDDYKLSLYQDRSVVAPQVPLEAEIQFVLASSIRRRAQCRLATEDTRLVSPYRQKATNERVYAQTLQQVDELITNMETEFKKKLADMEHTLVDKRWKLEECERKLATVSSTREIENHLTEKTLNLEMEIAALKRKLKSNEEEKVLWQRKEGDLAEEMERLNAVVVRTEAGKVELLEQLEKERTANREYVEELAFKKKMILDLEVQHANQIKNLENRLQRAKREVENQEVTNSELKEEVETLENAICEINVTLERERDEKEKLMIQFRKELARKQQEIDSLKRLSQDMTAVSTAQEIGFLQRQQTDTISISPNHQFYEERSRISKSECSTDHEDEDMHGEEFDHEDYDNDTATENSSTNKNETQSTSRLMRYKNGYTILLRKLPTASNYC